MFYQRFPRATFDQSKSMRLLPGSKPSSTTIASINLALFLWVMAANASAQTYTTLYSFSNGSGPAAISLQAADGNFYGTLPGLGDPLFNCGGAGDDCGSIFKITAGGVPTTLASFASAVASQPNPGLVQDAEGNFYGTTAYGGTGTGCEEATPCGTVFELPTGGNLTLLYSFSTPGGAYPGAGLVWGNDGNLYGTTLAIASTLPNDCCGTLFKITPSGTETVLYAFPSVVNGAYPAAPLVLGTDGNFYGTTQSSSIYNGGTVFQITPAGVLTTLYSFCATGPPCNDGFSPNALILGTDGNFYGTTQSYGANNGGTVFRITSAGVLTTLYSFCAQTNCADGSTPRATLAEGSDGSFYGTTYSGGSGAACTSSGGCGTIFEISSSGILSTLYNFCSQANCSDGSAPIAGLLQAADRVFYGTTTLKGSNDAGTLFSLSTGLNGSAASTTTLGLQPASLTIGQAETVALAATVVPASGSGTPTGTVAFSSASSYLGTAPLSGGVGTLNYDASGLTAGTYQITAAYSGDATYAVSTSSTQLTVNPAPPADFQVSSSVTSLTVAAGQSANTTLTVNPENGFDSQVSFSCSGLPSGVTCSFDPATVTPSGISAVTSTLTVAMSASAALRHPGLEPLRWTYALLLPCLGVVLCSFGNSRRRAHGLGPIAVMSVLVLWGLTACSSSPHSQTQSTQPQSTQATIMVTATTGGSAAITHSVNLTVTVTQ
jgi:uncharacterized repeat protein (TIGR03803 family)